MINVDLGMIGFLMYITASDRFRFKRMKNLRNIFFEF